MHREVIFLFLFFLGGLYLGSIDAPRRKVPDCKKMSGECAAKLASILPAALMCIGDDLCDDLVKVAEMVMNDCCDQSQSTSST